MARLAAFVRISSFAASVLLAVACGGGASPRLPVLPGPAPGVAAPDFLLPDVNPSSATSLASVSPRQHLTRISAWYFGHAT